jgi:hypothetical protein
MKPQMNSLITISFWSCLIAVASAGVLGASIVWFTPAKSRGNQASTHTTVGNVTQTVTMPQSAADSGKVPQTAARLRGGYTTAEFASLVGLSVREIQDRCANGEMCCIRAANGHYLIPLEIVQ